MTAVETDNVIAEMARIRSRSAQQAQQVVQDIQCAGDWREYVKAHALPSIISAAVLGYALIPNRRSGPSPSTSVTTGSKELPDKLAPSTKNIATAGLGDFFGSWMGTLVVSSLKQIAAQQFATLIERMSDDSHTQSHKPKFGSTEDNSAEKSRAN